MEPFRSQTTACLKLLFSYTENFALFWRYHPALYYGFWALPALYPEFYPYSFLLILPFSWPLSFSWPFCHLKQMHLLFLGILFFSAVAIWHKGVLLFPSEEQEGKGILSLNEVHLNKGTFHTSWILKGTLEHFYKIGRAHV